MILHSKATRVVLTVSVVLTMTLGLLITGSITWGFEIPNFRSRAVQKGLVPAREFTVDELALHDGSDERYPVYIASTALPKFAILDREM